MKTFFFSLLTLTALSNSFVFAMDDDKDDKNFKGNILVIGGTTQKNPERVSLNIEKPADIIGSGWDSEFIQATFTNNKYQRVIFEHVGFSLETPDDGQFCNDPDGLAQTYFNLLKPGGNFNFLTWGDTYRNWVADSPLKDARDLLQHLGVKYDEATQKLTLKSRPDLADKFQDRLNILNQNQHIHTTVEALNAAGFKEIDVHWEKRGEIVGVYTHDSIHISAKKPE